MAPSRPPAGDKPGPRKSNPAAGKDSGTTDREREAHQATESELAAVRSSETVVARIPEGVSSETVVGVRVPEAAEAKTNETLVGGVVPVVDSSSGEARTGELPPLPAKPRRTGELRVSKALDEPPRRKATAELKVARETMAATPKAIGGGVVPKPDDTADQITDRKPALKGESPRRRPTAELKLSEAKALGTQPDLARPSGRLDETSEPGRTGEEEVFESRTELKLAPRGEKKPSPADTLSGGTNPSLKVKNARLDRLVIGIVAGALVVVLTAVLIAWGGGGKKAPPRHHVAQHEEGDEPTEPALDDQPALHATAVPVRPSPEPAPAAAPVAVDAGLASGLVRFESDPPSEVLIGGENKGTTPFFLALPVGHTKALFNCARIGMKRTVEFDVVAGKETTASTAFATGWVELHANAGATIAVDGKPAANRLLSLLTGTHHIEAKFPSGATASETVEVVQGMTITVYLEPDTHER